MVFCQAQLNITGLGLVLTLFPPAPTNPPIHPTDQISSEIAAETLAKLKFKWAGFILNPSSSSTYPPTRLD